MRDIRYKWNEGPNSVGVSNEVSLPQFKVLGHRQRAMEISLTTGNTNLRICVQRFSFDHYCRITRVCRQLFAISLRNTIRQIHGVLPNTNLHTFRPDCDHFLGELLAEQKRYSGSRIARCDYRAYNDDADVFDERRVAQNFVRQIDRRILGYLFRHGIRFIIR